MTTKCLMCFSSPSFGGFAGWSGLPGFAGFAGCAGCAGLPGWPGFAACCAALGPWAFGCGPLPAAAAVTTIAAAAARARIALDRVPRDRCMSFPPFGRCCAKHLPGRPISERDEGGGRLGPVRICLVTPFAWSQPHDVNEHVAGVAKELRGLGHSVTILASSNRAKELAAGRRALLDGLDAEVVALGPAVPISRRSRIGVPVGARANLSLALALGRFDIVHGFEPGLPSLSYLALRDAQAMTVATFLNAERLGYPPGRAQRDRLLGRIDALVVTNEQTAEAAAIRFPGEYRVVSEGVDPELFRRGPKRNLIVLEWRPNERALLRGVFRALEELTDWELVLLRTKPLAGRPTIPRLLRDRVHVRTAREGATRAPLLAEASIFVPALAGLERVRLEASASACAIASPPGTREQPELAGAEVARLAEDPEFRERKAERARADAEGQSFTDVARELDGLYRSLTERRHAPHRSDDPLADRPWVLCDLHMHTSWSHDCAVDAADLIMHAEAIGLGAIAVTDHNVFGGALETSTLARDHDLVVIPGEEVKTD